VAFLPAIGFALFTGHVADRLDRRLILIVSYGLLTACGVGLFALAYTGSRLVWPIYVLVFVFGAGRAFANPAGQALVPNLVPLDDFPNAVAWNSSVFQTATIIGPALGGLLYAFGATVVFGTATACYAITVLLLAAMRIRRVAQGVREPVTWAALIAGFTFIRSRPVILGAISLDLFAVLLGGATALLPIYAGEILHVGPWGLGLLRSMPAAGAVVTALVLAQRPLDRRTGRRMLQAVGVFGLATIGFGLSTSLPLSMLCLFVLGAADMVSVFVRQTLVQLDTPDAMRGRVAAVNTVFIGASNELGEFESGVVAGLIGTVPAVVAGGIGTLLVAVLWARWFPALRDRDRLAG
jgi:MFS family permease